MKTLRVTLIVLELIVAVNAFGGAIYALSGAPTVPVEWLRGTPFRDYTVPGLFLLAGGLGMVLAAVAQLSRWPAAARWSEIVGALLMLWIIVQVAIIGYVSWMQPVSFIAGAVILGMAMWMARKSGEHWPRRAGRWSANDV